MRIDLNADLGESFGIWRLGDDEALLDVVTSANVACGFHAGDPSVLRRTCAAAAERGVRIGAHVSYRDLAGFGRRFVDMAADELADDVTYQIGALDGFARAVGSKVSYVKPHGALYHAVLDNDGQAEAVVTGVRRYLGPDVGGDTSLAVLGMPGSALLAAAQRAGLRAVPEAFADRGYTPEGALVPRGRPGAVLHDPQHVAARVVRLARERVLTAVDGSEVAVGAESVCVHGDTPGAAAMAAAVRAALNEQGILVAAFT